MSKTTPTEKITPYDSSIKQDIHLDSLENGSIIEHDLDGENVFVTTEDGPDYRGVTMVGAAVLIAKSQIGLGVLGLPSTMDVLGFVPGLISLIGLCILSTWTGLTIGKFRLTHPKVYSVDDAAALMFGTAAREVMGIGFWLFYTLCYGAALLTLSMAFNTFSGHGMCTTAYVGIAAGISFVLTLFTRTMKVLSWLGYVAVSAIFVAIWVVAIACLTQSTPAAAPEGEPVHKIIEVVSTSSSYMSIASAVATQLLSLCGTASFFTIHAEMKDQRQYSKSLLLGQGFVVFNYIVISCIMYAKVGQYIASPALGSAGHLFQKVGYGIALPGLLFSAFFQAHIAAKYGLVRVLRKSEHLQKNSKTHWITWILTVTIVIIVGFVVAGAIPFFGDLLALIGALLGTFFTLIIPAFLSLYDMSYNSNNGSVNGFEWIYKSNGVWTRSKKNMTKTALSFFCIIVGAYICVSGVYGSVASIVNSYADGSLDRPFSCADNS